MDILLNPFVWFGITVLLLFLGAYAGKTANPFDNMLVAALKKALEDLRKELKKK